MQTSVILNDQAFTIDQLRSKFNLPENVTIEGCHVYANDSEELVRALKFRHFVAQFPVDGFSGKSFQKLQSIPELFDTPINLFNSEIVNQSSLSRIGFGPRQSVAFIQGLQLYKTKGVKMRSIIKSFGITGCGTTISKEFAKYFLNQEYSFSGLDKSIIEKLLSMQDEIMSIVDQLGAFGYPIDNEPIEKPVSADSIKFVLTGSPKEFGYKTKEEFKKEIQNWVDVKDNLKDATYLITDSLESKSSKTKMATKLGVQIITYDQAIEIYSETVTLTQS